MTMLITETIDPSRKPVSSELCEDTSNGGKFLLLKGLFIEGEVQNRNGRVYPRSEIESAVKQIEQRIAENGPVAGELDHPDDMHINFDRVALAITEMHMEGNNGHGTMKVMNAGKGLIIKGAVEVGINVGVSSRGTGNIGHNGFVSDFNIVTVDAVINPSAPSAYPQASLSEALNRYKSGREALSLTESMKNDPAAQKHFERELKNFFVAIRDEVSWSKK